MFYLEKYGTTYVTDKRDSNNYELKKTLNESYFIHKTVLIEKYQVLIQSSLNNLIYAFPGVGSYTYTHPVWTNSRVLDIDVNEEGVLLAGFENGDLREYLWDPSKG